MKILAWALAVAQATAVVSVSAEGGDAERGQYLGVKVATPGGPIPAPPGKGQSDCTPWAPGGPSDPLAASAGGGSPLTMIGDDGRTLTYYVRLCGGEVQAVWVPPYTPTEVAAPAYDEVVRLVPKPAVSFNPAIDSQFVNFESHFGVTPIAPVTATASVPGLSATVTATVVSIELATGSIVRTDPKVITCRPWGSSKAARDGCVWKPTYPSVDKVTGTNDHRHHGSITLVWDVVWTSSTGASGTRAQIRTTTPVLMAVREIQTY